MARITETVDISFGKGIESLMGKIAVILLVVWVLAALMGNPEAGRVQHDVARRNLPGTGGKWATGPHNRRITRQEWVTAVGMAQG